MHEPRASNDIKENTGDRHENRIPRQHSLVLYDWQYVRPAVGYPLTFEVASVKPSLEARGLFFRYLPGGGLRVAGATLKNLIAMVYGVREFLVLGRTVVAR